MSITDLSIAREIGEYLGILKSKTKSLKEALAEKSKRVDELENEVKFLRRLVDHLKGR